jgi:hypothetical protein
MAMLGNNVPVQRQFFGRNGQIISGISGKSFNLTGKISILIPHLNRH